MSQRSSACAHAASPRRHSRHSWRGGFFFFPNIGSLGFPLPPQAVLVGSAEPAALNKEERARYAPATTQDRIRSREPPAHGQANAGYRSNTPAPAGPGAPTSHTRRAVCHEPLDPVGKVRLAQRKMHAAPRDPADEPLALASQACAPIPPLPNPNSFRILEYWTTTAYFFPSTPTEQCPNGVVSQRRSVCGRTASPRDTRDTRGAGFFPSANGEGSLTIKRAPGRWEDTRVAARKTDLRPSPPPSGRDAA